MAGLRRTGDLLHRRLLLWRGGEAGYLTPRGVAGGGEPTAVLVLQAGPNPTVDYFVRPRIQADASGLTWEIVNLETSPESVPLLRHPGTRVIVCRYINPAWLEALERHAPQLCGVTYLVDDDLPAMLRDPTVPASARGRILRDYERHRTRLEALVSAVWTTSVMLAAAMPCRPSRVLEPVPTEEPPVWSAPPPPLVVYHGGATHDAERRFVYTVAQLLEQKRPDIRFELAESPSSRRPDRRANVRRVPFTGWKTYLHDQRGRHAAVMLAPLFESPVNNARAAVKFFDATRLGAAGVFADAPAYNAFVRPGSDGLILPMVASEWAAAIERLVDQERLRAGLVAKARDRVAAMWRSAAPFDFTAGES